MEDCQKHVNLAPDVDAYAIREWFLDRYLDVPSVVTTLCAKPFTTNIPTIRTEEWLISNKFMEATNNVVYRAAK